MADQKIDRTKSVKCVRDWRDFTLDYYALPTDGRQWRSQASKRRQLAEYLATFADGDGTNIKIGIERMCAKFDPVDRATIFRWLDDLRELEALAPKSGLTSRHGCAVRELTLDRFVARYDALIQQQCDELDKFQEVANSVLRSRKVEVKESQSQFKESQSQVEFATQPSFTVLTDQNKPTNKQTA